MKRDRALDRIATAAICLIVFFTHFASGVSFASDSKWTIHTALSLIREGNTDLDEYRDLTARLDEYGAIETFGGHSYTNFPIGPSLVAAPFVYAIDQIGRRSGSLDLHAYAGQAIPVDVERFVASIVVALTSVVIYHIARQFLSRRRSLFVVFVFAFGTPAWSTASRALWQHGPSMLMLSLTLYLLVRARHSPRLSQFAGLPLALSYLMRPSNNISIVLLTLYVFIQHRPYFTRYLLWAATVAVPFVAYNVSIYQSPLSPYYLLYRSTSPGGFVEALVGTLFSPSRGLFIFSPILLLSMVGVARSIRRRALDRLDACLLAIILLHWIVTSLWPIWWGGWSFGPRLLSDLVPYLTYLMLPVVADLPAPIPIRRAGSRTLALALVGLSFFVHYRGANVEAVTLEWNGFPANVDTQPGRVWNWRDIQFLRGIPWGAPADVSLAGVPIRQMDAATHQVLGTNVLRARRFDASASAIAAPGTSWLVIADQQLVAEELAPLFAGVNPRAAGQTPETGIAYRIYAFDLGERIRQAASSAERVALRSTDLYPGPDQALRVELPASFGPVAELIGFRVIAEPASSRVTVLTYWQARDRNATPLRVFVHAIGQAGELIAQADRLDARGEDWRPGDLLAQVNRLDIPTGSGPFWIEIGIYDPDSGERLPVILNGIPIDQRLLLKQMEIK